MRNKDINVAITGARSVEMLNETLKSLDVLKLFDDKLD
jgi:aryl-alcohol dehydrogenase-like predicted oxidoreductase